MRRQIEKAARTTAGIYKINQGHICGFVLPLPSLAEQAEIVRVLRGRLEAAEGLDSEIDASLVRADLLRQSILKRAFAGQLVPRIRTTSLPPPFWSGFRSSAPTRLRGDGDSG